jgi:hypothetical protein
MRYVRWRDVLISAAVVLADWSVASACEPAALVAHEIIANPADETGPSAPGVVVEEFTRGDEWAPDGVSCGPTETSCDGTASLHLRLSSTDDVSAPEAIGYRVESTNPDFTTQMLVVRIAADGSLFLLAGGDDGKKDLKFSLTVTAVDEAGNVSAPTTVRVNERGSLNCRVGSWSNAAPYGLLLLVLLLRNRRRSVA